MYSKNVRALFYSYFIQVDARVFRCLWVSILIREVQGLSSKSRRGYKKVSLLLLVVTSNRGPGPAYHSPLVYFFLIPRLNKKDSGSHTFTLCQYPLVQDRYGD